LKSDICTVLPPELVIIEILENIEPTQEVLRLCKELKQLGYIIALDDFVFSNKYRKLIEIVDIIKIDFKITKGYERKKVIDMVNAKGIRFLAEKVETMEEFNEAVSFGYSYFQGYYFCKPLIISGKRISENKYVYIKLLQEINSNRFTIDNIENLMKSDLSLSFKLLKLLNSANYSFSREIKSIKQAMVLIGEKEIKKWLYLIVFKTLGEDKPGIILINSLTRARFSELIAHKISVEINPFNAYLIGMLSLINLLLDRPLDQILNELLIPIEVKDALNRISNNSYSKLLNLIMEYEKGQWKQVSIISNELNLDQKWLPDAYYEAILYSKIYT